MKQKQKKTEQIEAKPIVVPETKSIMARLEKAIKDKRKKKKPKKRQKHDGEEYICVCRVRGCTIGPMSWRRKR